jgi:putative Holliday junction resolvase
MGEPTHSPGRVMALDVGEVRIGVAVSDRLCIAAHPLTVLDRTQIERDVAEILRIAEEQSAAKIVVGMPLTLRGVEGFSAARVRDLVEALAAAGTVPVEAWDERLTTRQAERVMADDGEDERSRRGKVDKVAAALILQSYLDAARRRGVSPIAPPSDG